MLVSKPDCEKRQMSAALVPETGRVRATGFPPRLQPFVEVLKAPSAATLRSKEAEELSTPAVVGSTTAIFLPGVEGGELGREMTSSVVSGATTMRGTMLERVTVGVCIWTETRAALTR